MIFEETDEQIDGLRLRRYDWRPEGAIRGGVALMHGLGDYLLRYEHVARFFVERGFACEGFDFPGHGKSSGQRGHIPGWDLFAELLDRSLGRLRQLTDGKGAGQGLFAHSMGAYVSLDYLSKRPGPVQFAWLSSPLIRPSHGRPRWLVRIADPLGRWLPRFPYDIGIRAKDCVPDDAPRLEERARDPYLHHVTTLGLGRALVLRESAVRKGAASLSGELDLLVTHGTEDLACPYWISRELFDEIPLARKRFVPVAGELHEPLHGTRQEEVFAAAAQWIEEVVARQL